MALTDSQKLRMLLGEDIPLSGTEDDTMFKDVEILDYLENNPNVERAAYEGWRVKAARLATLVDTTEGNAQRKFSKMFENAQEMVKTYAKSSGGPTEGRARTGRIRREGVQWS